MTAYRLYVRSPNGSIQIMRFLSLRWGSYRPAVSRRRVGNRVVNQKGHPKECPPEHGPVLPATPTCPFSMTSNATSAVVHRVRNSNQRMRRPALLRARCSRPNSVTALAMASSRHRFNVRKSSALTVARRSTAKSVIDWQTSP